MAGGAALPLGAALLPLTLAWDVLASLIWQVRVARALVQAQGACPQGHEVELIGAFACTCGLTAERHAWSPCPHCAQQSYAIRCACSLPVVNPIYRPRA